MKFNSILNNLFYKHNMNDQQIQEMESTRQELALFQMNQLKINADMGRRMDVIEKDLIQLKISVLSADTIAFLVKLKGIFKI